jgi:CHAT domain-containing protein/Tfp pilus assembly protein PilF
MMRFKLSSTSLLLAIVLSSPIVPAVLVEVTIAQSKVPEDTGANPTQQLLAQAKRHYRQAEFKQAIALYQQVLSSNPDAKFQIEALLQLAEIDIWTKKVDRAETKGKQALDIAKASGDRRGEGQSLIILAIVKRSRQNYAQATDFVNQSLKIGQELGDRSLMAKVQQQLGILHVLQQQLPQALEKFQQALKLAQAENAQEAILESHTWTALTYQKQENFPQAESWIQKQQSLSQAFGDRLEEYDGLGVMVLIRQGQKQSETILPLRQKQLAIAQASGNLWFEKDVLIEIGYLDIAQKKFIEGQRIYQQALAIAQKIDDRAIASVQLSIIYGHILQLLSFQSEQKYEPAIAAGRQALAVAQKMQELAKRSADQVIESQALEVLGDSAGNLSIVAYKNNQADLGKQYHQQSVIAFEQGIVLAQKMNDRVKELNAMSSLSLLYVSQGQYLSRLTQYQESIEMFDRGIALFAQGKALSKINNFQREKSWIKNISYAYIGKGDSLSKQLKYLEAAEALTQGLSFLRSQKSRLPQTEFSKGEMDLLNLLSIFYDSAGQYNQSIINREAAFAIAVQLNDFQSQVSHLAFIASRQRQLGENQKSLQTAQKALEIARNNLKNSDREVQALISVGQALYEIGRYPESRDHYQQAISIAQSLKKLVTVQQLLSNISTTYHSQGEYLQALDPLKQAQENLQAVLPRIEAGDQAAINGWCGQSFINLGLDGQKQCFGMIEIALASVFNNLATTYQEIGQYDEALVTFQKAIAISQKYDDRDSQTIYLNNLGNLYVTMGDFPLALESLQQSLKMATQYKITSTQARALNNIGTVYRAQGNTVQALEIFQKGLTINQSSQDPSIVATILNNIGLTHGDMGDSGQALVFLQRSLALNQKHGRDPSTTLNNLATFEAAQGRYPEAMKKLEQILTIARRSGNKPFEAFTLRNIGDLYAEQSDYAKARTFYQQARELVQQTGNRPEQLSDLLAQGIFYVSLGDYPKALDFSQQALKLSQALGQKPQEISALTTIAGTYRKQKQYEQALPLYQQAVTIARETRNIKMEQRILQRVAETYEGQGDRPKAIALLEQVLKKQQELGIQPAQIYTLNSLGRIYIAQGRLTEAQNSLQAAQVLLGSVNAPEVRAEVFANLASLFARRNQPELAIAFYKKSVSLYEDIRKGLTPLPKDQQQSYTETIAQTYRDLADLLLKNDRILEAQQILDLLKLQELDEYIRNVRGGTQAITFRKAETELLDKFDLSQKNVFEIIQRLRELQAKPDRTPSETAELTKLGDLREALIAQKNQFFEQPDVKQLLQQLRAENNTPDTKTLQNLQRNLKQVSNAAILYPLILPDRLELVLFTADAPPLRRTVPLPKTELNSTIQTFLSGLRNPTIDPRPEAQKLYNWIIQPLEAELKTANIKTIIYAPDSQLRYIPLAALYDGKQWLTERYQFNHITAESVTALQPTPRNSLKVLAGSISGDKQQKYAIEVGQQRHDFSGLPYAKEEVENIASVIPNTSKYIGQQFDLTALKNDFENYKVLHFATHGYFDISTKEKSFLLFGGKTANGQPQVATLADIANWSLFNVDLVVLSACETGISDRLGNKRLGEGIEVLGLGYQFQQSGAKATISSLWRVDDWGTQVLMSAFYKQLSQGNISTIGALQQAQIVLIRSDKPALTQLNRGRFINLSQVTPVETKGTSRPIWNNPEKPLSHPYYWAPFILIGNGL